MRRIAHRIAVTLARALSALTASAQAYPERQVRLIVPFLAGSTLDKLARQVAERMGEQLKGTVVVENITGAGGVVGVQAVVCGHIHHAEIREIDGILYCNDGDWVESLTALVEHDDGRLEIYEAMNQQGAHPLPATLPTPLAEPVAETPVLVS